MSNIRISCFGARGSIPSPSYEGFRTDKYGGNTTCYYLEAGPFQIILDMGSGARILGDFLTKKYDMFNPKYTGKEFIFFLSHYHHDHVEGIPFHAPFYNGKNRYRIHGMVPRQEKNSKSFVENKVLEMLEKNQQTPFFPVPLRELPAGKSYVAHSPMFHERFVYRYDDEENEYTMEIVDNNSEFNSADPNCLGLTTIPLNHPDGAIGFRLDYLGESIACLSDNENYVYPNANFQVLAKDVDLVIMDGQYTEAELSGHAQGFGHGQPELNIDEAIAMGVKKIIITHHAPDHDDGFVSEMERNAKQYLDQKQQKLGKKCKTEEIEFAREGDSWEV